MARYQSAEFSVNGEPIQFPLVDGSEAEPVDLLIVATKYNGLRSAMEVMENAVGKDTVIISVLNGISSEKILAEKFDENQVCAVRGQLHSTFLHTHSLLMLSHAITKCKLNFLFCTKFSFLHKFECVK